MSKFVRVGLAYVNADNIVSIEVSVINKCTIVFMCNGEQHRDYDKTPDDIIAEIEGAKESDNECDA